MLDEFDVILGLAQRAGASWRTVSDVGSSNARRIITDVPTYYIERELVLRLEGQNRPIDENDFRDMQSFCTVCAYADLMVAENQFINLALQGGIDKKYSTRISTDIFTLGETLSQLSAEV
jgi:hypothetical protein